MNTNKLTMHPIDTAPKDGRLLFLLLLNDDDRDNALEDTNGLSPTIGFNNDDNVCEEGKQGWQFAGWNWSQDYFTEGKGNPIWWAELPRNFDFKALTEVEKTLEWVEKEKLKGLISLHFSIKGVSDSTVESFCKEINEMIAAKTIEDKELF